MLLESKIKKRPNQIQQILDGVRSANTLAQDILRTDFSKIWLDALGCKSNFTEEEETGHIEAIEVTINRVIKVLGKDKSRMNSYLRVSYNYVGRIVKEENDRIANITRAKHLLFAEQDNEISALFKQNAMNRNYLAEIYVSDARIKRLFEDSKLVHYSDKYRIIRNMDSECGLYMPHLIWVNKDEFSKSLTAELTSIGVLELVKQKIAGREVEYYSIPRIIYNDLKDQNGMYLKRLTHLSMARESIKRLNDTLLANLHVQNKKVDILTRDLNMAYSIKSLYK